jgi:hypothetical protein
MAYLAGIAPLALVWLACLWVRRKMVENDAASGLSCEQPAEELTRQ